jgi:hypothetical protein
MKYAIFNSFPFHYEMFAHILDYFKAHNLQIDVFTNTQNNCGWLEFYESKFGPRIWHPISEFHPEFYDYVFVPTDDDRGYVQHWHNKTAKVIVIEHAGNRTLGLPAHRTFQTRQFKQRQPPSSPDTWMLPVWYGLQVEKYEKLTVLCLGNATNHLNIQSLFKNHTEINFILVDRYMNTADSTANTQKYNSLDTSKLIEFTAKSHYSLFWPTTGFAWNHQYNSLSGSIPLAFSLQTIPLVPQSFLEPIGLPGIVGIPDGGDFELKKPTEEQVAALNTGLDDLLARRDRLLDSALCL